MPANPQRGEVDLVVAQDDGSEKVYTLFLSVNSVCVMQQRTKKTFGQLVAGLMGLDFEALRELTWLLLKKHHAREFQTVEKVGDLIDLVGVNQMTSVMEELFRLNQPPKKEEPAKDGDADPQTASTGTDSISTPGEAA